MTIIKEMRKSNYIPLVFVICIVASFVFSGCKKSDPETYNEYLSWINDPDNGYIKERRVWGIVYQARYLPSDYLVLKDLKDKTIDLKNTDSLFSIYDSCLTIMLTIGPNNELQEKTDLFMNGVKDLNEFKERVQLLSFNMSEQIKLKTGNLISKPVLYNYENIYGLKPDRDFIFVFAPESLSQKEFYSSDTLDVIYEDKIFGTGIHHFIFLRNQINRKPLQNKLKNQISI
ncbi:MAG: hypothetical protein HY951_06450 [Bacteroidia bacterium]|nr:hypothetical protein [Bacteroidia bacterium]